MQSPPAVSQPHAGAPTASPTRATPLPPHLPRMPRWFWVMPWLALALALVTVGGLLWVLHKSDQENQRDNLISDVLWIEQNLHFRMEHNQSRLQELGQDRNAGLINEAGFEVRAQQILAEGNGLVRVQLLDKQGHSRAELPPAPNGPTQPASDTLHLVQRLGQAAYSPLAPLPNHDHGFEIHVPLFAAGQPAGTVVGYYSLKNLLAETAPWWFAEKYRINLTDDAGNLLASKSDVVGDPPNDPLLTYQEPLDPPGHGLTMQVMAYRAETRLLPATLVSTIVALAAAIVWSLWALRRHVYRRYDAEQALRAEYAFRRAMEDSLVIGLHARDLTGKVTFVNPAFCRMVGYGPEDLLGKGPDMPYWDAEHREQSGDLSQKVLAGAAPEEGFEMKLRHKDGRLVIALVYATPLIDGEGQHIGWMSSVLDVTEARRMEEQARLQEERLQFTARLVAMGEMASSLAHELNQPLTAISSYSTGCLNRLGQAEMKSEELAEPLAKISRQAQRAGQIIRRIHNFVRRSEPRRVTCSLNTIVEDALGLMDAEARKRGLRIETALQDALPQIEADPVMIEQVVVNLLRNAMDAMAENPPERRLIQVETHHGSDQVQLAITDQGSGISEHVAAKLFAPFFSTKSEGMGMGLNICRSIAELHQGRLWFESLEPGCRFHLSLPVT